MQLLLGLQSTFKTNPSWAFHCKFFCWLALSGFNAINLSKQYITASLSGLRAIRRIDRLIKNDQFVQIAIADHIFYATVLTGRGQSTSVIAPFHRNHWFFVNFRSNMLLDFAVFNWLAWWLVRRSNRNNVAGTLAERHPVMVDGVSVKIHPFDCLTVIGVRSLSDIVISNAGWDKNYLVSSFERAQDRSAHIFVFGLTLQSPNLESHHSI